MIDIELDKVNSEKIEETGQAVLEESHKNDNIYLMSIIGEIEGHELASNVTKTTKYEHLLPKIAEIEDNEDINGVLILLQTTGGDCSAGLAIAEMIASLSKPTVSLICGDCHSIGVPLAVAADYTYIVTTGTMIIHPVRMSGTIIGAPQTFDYFKLIQDRIVGFITTHSKMSQDRVEELMFAKSILTKDLGTILVGQDTVNEGLVNSIGGIDQALKKLHSMIKENN